MFSLGFNNSQYTAPSWSHQMQSITLAPWIFDLAVDVEACPCIPHDILRFRLSEWTHFSSPVTMRYKNPFRFCLQSSCSQANKRRSTSLGFNSYGIQFPCFWILLMEAENQNFPQMTRIRLGNWHLQSRINLWYKHKLINLVLSLCWQMFKLTV